MLYFFPRVDSQDTMEGYGFIRSTVGLSHWIFRTVLAPWIFLDRPCFVHGDCARASNCKSNECFKSVFLSKYVT